MADPLTLGAFVLFGMGLWAGTAKVYRMVRGAPEPPEAPRERAESVRRVLKHVKRVPVAQLEEGAAAVVEGTVRAIAGVELAVSPIRKRPCLGFHLEIRHARFGGQRFALQLLHDRAEGVTCEVEDDAGGVIRVDGQGLELAITDGEATYFPVLPPAIRHLVPPGFAHEPVTVEEGILFPGARVLVGGVVARLPVAAQYRDATATQLALVATPQFPLVASSDADLRLAGERPIEPAQLFRATRA